MLNEPWQSEHGKYWLQGQVYKDLKYQAVRYYGAVIKMEHTNMLQFRPIII